MSTDWLPFWYLENTVLNMCYLARTVINLIDHHRQSIRCFLCRCFSCTGNSKRFNGFYTLSRFSLFTEEFEPDILLVFLNDSCEGYDKEYSCLGKLWSHACM